MASERPSPTRTSARAFPPQYRLSVVLNPSSGAGKAREVWRNVEAQLKEAAQGGDDPKEREGSWLEWEVQETEKAGDGERIGRELAQRFEEDSTERHALLVLGGDGTVHEVLNGLLVRESGRIAKEEVELVLVPTSTANALYYSLFPPSSPSYPSDSPSSHLYSLDSFLSRFSAPSSASATRSSRLLPVSLALNTVPSTPPVLTTVVSSAALHASILHDAEALRASHPSIERFKLAAQQNANRWTSGTLRLEGAVKRYSAAREGWIEKGEEATVEGEFAYLTSALVVDRFEPAFVVAPFRSPSSHLAPSPSSASVDLIVIRPLRHAPTAALVRAGKAQDAKDGFVARVWEVSGGMYSDGKHIGMIYAEEERGEKGEEGAEMAEVWRCEGFEWEPAPSSEVKDRLVCLDGAVHDLGEGAGRRLTVRALGVGETGVRVWA
ncbi:hypothetical protein JCM10213_003251 [Rhodosporidiobolus nylandii]